jgi:hypothetical protein
MKKGFKITYNKAKNAKTPWEITWTGDEQIISNIDFGNGDKPILKCVKCGVIHWKDLEGKGELK